MCCVLNCGNGRNMLDMQNEKKIALQKNYLAPDLIFFALLFERETIEINCTLLTYRRHCCRSRLEILIIYTSLLHLTLRHQKSTLKIVCFM